MTNSTINGVAVMGRKGGIGKTTFAHLLALGAAWKGVPAYLFHTDDREPLSVNGRPYGYFDARDPKDLERLIGAVVNQDGLCIIDSGGNRPKFDQWIAETVDLVLIPVGPDEEDVVVGLEHMEMLEKAGAKKVRFILNKFPAVKVERDYVEREYYSRLPIDKVIGKMGDVRAVRTLRQSDKPAFQTPPSKVNNLARKLYFTVKDELDSERETAIRAA